MTSRAAAVDGDAGHELAARTEEAGVRHIHLQFSDVLGTVKTVRIPADGLPSAMETGVWFDGSSVEGFTRTAESDMYLAPDPTTLQVLLAARRRHRAGRTRSLGRVRRHLPPPARPGGHCPSGGAAASVPLSQIGR